MDALAALLEAWGLGVVALSVLADQSGLPLPSYPTLIAASALAPRAGHPASLIVVVAVAAAVVADVGWYVAGSRMGRSVLCGLCRATQAPDACVRTTETTFVRYGLSCLLVVKFVPGLSALAAALAGATRVSPLRYFSVDIVGAAVWAGTAVVIGDVFRDAVSDTIVALMRFGRYGALAVVAAIGAYVLLRVVRRRQRRA